MPSSKFEKLLLNEGGGHPTPAQYLCLILEPRRKVRYENFFKDRCPKNEPPVKNLFAEKALAISEKSGKIVRGWHPPLLPTPSAKFDVCNLLFKTLSTPPSLGRWSVYSRKKVLVNSSLLYNLSLIHLSVNGENSICDYTGVWPTRPPPPPNPHDIRCGYLKAWYRQGYTLNNIAKCC